MTTQAQESESAAYRNAALPVEQRVEDLFARLTPDEKIDMIGGKDDFYIRGNERLGLPAIKMSDGPVGVRNDGPTTAYPAGIALAASWDLDLAARYGVALGRDARARGVHYLLGPGVNVYRVPQCGRNFEYFGEDPYLAARMAVAYIRGVQSQGVAATVKHFAANNHENDRGRDSSDLDERTLNEIYFPAFRASVQEAHVRAVMCSYNLVNGTYTSANDWLLNRALKQAWGFDGIVMSDWGAAHETLGCVNGGLDVEMPSGAFMNRDAIRPLMESGQIAQSTIDDKMRRILRVMIGMGWLDRAQKDSRIPLDDPQNAAVALEAARDGIVLLRNRDDLLPLDRSRIKTIAVFGPNTDPAVTGGGGSSYTQPFHSVSALEGIRAVAGKDVAVLHIPAGVEVRYRRLFSNAAYVEPLKAAYFDNKDLAGEPVLTREETSIDYDWRREPRPASFTGDAFSARWTGSIRPEASGEYDVVIQSDDGSRVRLDGETILNLWRDHGVLSQTKRIALEAGRTYALEIEYYNSVGEAVMRFGWGEPQGILLEDELAQIRRADAAIVCAGFNPYLETEGIDRSFELPEGQDELIAAVADANPHTVVALNAGGAVDMRSWIDRVSALLMAWYPGQEGGTALAEILFGEVNPSGKLPASFEKRWEDAAAYGNFPAVNNHLRYAEGLFVGYRHFDAKQIEPMFPFGFGLSYTKFDYSNLVISPSDGEPQDTVQVSFDVENTGARAGAEVAQLYVHDAEASVERPVKELKGFGKIFLQPGERRSVRLDLDRSAFSFYDPATHAWIDEPGTFEILIGASSRDIRLRGSYALSSKRN